MKRIVLAFVLMCIALVAVAKTAYIPTYHCYLSLTKDNQTTHMMDSVREVSIGYDNDRVVFTVLHEEVTPSKVKSIKRAKANAAWNAAAWGFALGMSPNSTQTMLYSMAAKDDIKAREQIVEEEKTLKIVLLVENNTDQTIFVSELTQGAASWYIAPQSSITLSVSNPGNMQYRVSNVYLLDPTASAIDQETAYVTVEAQSTLTKTSVDYEFDDCWLWTVYASDGTMAGNFMPSLQYCKRLDKETFQWSTIDEEEFERLKKEKKEAAKREKYRSEYRLGL